MQEPANSNTLCCIDRIRGCADVTSYLLLPPPLCNITDLHASDNNAFHSARYLPSAVSSSNRVSLNRLRHLYVFLGLLRLDPARRNSVQAVEQLKQLNARFCHNLAHTCIPHPVVFSASTNRYIHHHDQLIVAQNHNYRYVCHASLRLTTHRLTIIAVTRRSAASSMTTSTL